MRENDLACVNKHNNTSNVVHTHNRISELADWYYK